MIQLALETSSRQPSIALLDGPIRVAEFVCRVDQVSTKDLVPEILNILKRSRFDASNIQLVSVSLGPGSFTGLRVGITTAKTLAYANQCPLIGIQTHHLLCRQAQSAISTADSPISNIRCIQSVIDAQRSEWFAASFRIDDSERARQQDPNFLVRPEDLAASVDQPTMWCGPALLRFQSLPAESTNICLAPETDWHPKAFTCGQIAFERYEAGHSDDIYAVRPYYGRKSAAEEKADLPS